jgi:integrase
MPTIKINNTSVSRIELPKDGERTFYWDEELKGFGVKALGTGLYYIVQRRIAGRGSKLVKHVIGKHGEISASQARNLAAQALADLRKGTDLNATKKKALMEMQTKGMTLAQAYAEFKASRDLRPRTLQTYDENINRTLKDWLDLPLASITPEMVQKKHKQISTAGKNGRGKGSANQAMRLLRVVFNYVIATKNNGNVVLVRENPVKILSQLDSWNVLEARDTVIQAVELKSWYAAVMSLESEKLQDFFLFLLFSGLRRNEAMRLEWTHFDVKAKVLTIPKELSKTKKKRQLPLTDVLLGIYKRRKQSIVLGNPHVFTGMHGKGHLTEPKRGVNFVRDESGINWSSHDLRRTYATVASRLDVSYYKLKFLLGHSTGNDVTGKHYAQIGVDDVREAAQEIADYLKREIGLEGLTVTEVV